jgi:tetratricopeptide (TPR) repeat protein
VKIKSMDEQAPKPHMERLKSEVELKVTGDESKPDSTEKASENNDKEHSRESASKESGDSASTEGSSRDIRVAVLAERKAKEQAFLAEYKQKQLRTRIKFSTVAVIFLGMFWTSMYFVCSKNAKASAALTQFQPVAVFACLGERDMAYFTMSNFNRAKGEPNVEPTLIKQRTKILERSIKDQEASGHPAIFTRLGTEQMLVRNGDRDAGLKFGDPLIAKYPDLPSNYLWRARIDFDHLDFANAVKSYEKAAEIISRSPEEVGQSFYSEFVKAIWASINSGQYEQANRFLDLAFKYGMNEYDRDALRSQILLSESDALAVSDLQGTDLLSKSLTDYNQKILREARKTAESLDYMKILLDGESVSDLYKYDLVFNSELKLGDLKAAKHEAEGWSKSYGARMEASIALAEGQPEKAYEVIKPYRGLDSYYGRYVEILAAEALLKTGHFDQALAAADAGINSYDTQEASSTAKLYLPLRILKAKALYESGDYQKAIAESDRILVINPHSVAAQLVKMKAFRKLQDFKAAETARNAALTELNALVESGKSSDKQG